MYDYLLSVFGVILYIVLFDTGDIFTVRSLASTTKPLVVRIYSYIYMYRLYHRLSGYTGNIPEVVTDKARGRSPRALSVTTEGIAQYSQACLWYNLFVAKATGARFKPVLTGLASTL